MPDGAFALYMAGQYNKRTAKKAAATRGACHGYLQFNKMVSPSARSIFCALSCRARPVFLASASHVDGGLIYVWIAVNSIAVVLSVYC